MSLPFILSLSLFALKREAWKLCFERDLEETAKKKKIKLNWGEKKVWKKWQNKKKIGLKTLKKLAKRKGKPSTTSSPKKIICLKIRNRIRNGNGNNVFFFLFLLDIPSFYRRILLLLLYIGFLFKLSLVIYKCCCFWFCYCCCCCFNTNLFVAFLSSSFFLIFGSISV